MEILKFENSARPVRKKSSSSKAMLGLAGIAAVALLGSTLAANISLNSGTGVEFGQGVAEIVSDVTDGAGKNRLERHLNTYYRTRMNDLSILVKMCDRWHNQQRSTERAERFMEMYHREYLYFKFALYQPNFYEDFWAELDEQYAKMDAIIKAR